MKAKIAAIIAIILALPMGLITTSIMFPTLPLEGFLQSILISQSGMPTILGFIFMYGGLFMLPVALVVALWPAVRRDAEGKRNFYLLNAIVAGIIIALMVPSWGSLAHEIYQCEVLQIPNCD